MQGFSDYCAVGNDFATHWYIANYSLQPSRMWLYENGKGIHDPGIRVENVQMATIQVKICTITLEPDKLYY